MSIAAKSSTKRKTTKKMTVETQKEASEALVESHSDSNDLPGDDSDAGNSSDDNSNVSDGEESKFNGNPGWANAMQKILKTNKPKKKKTLVLSRAKKISEVKPKDEEVPFEIEGEDGKVKTELIEQKVKADPAQVKAEKRNKKEKTKHSIRVKPCPLSRAREKTLQRIATRGVVQLFNAVKEQQQEIEKKLVAAGPLEGKREKVLKSIDKRAFLDVLMGGTKSITVDQKEVAPKKEEDQAEKSNQVWSVLRDDFVMGAKLKDWDKNAPEDEEDSSAPEDMDSD